MRGKADNKCKTFLATLSKQVENNLLSGVYKRGAFIRLTFPNEKKIWHFPFFSLLRELLRSNPLFRIILLLSLLSVHTCRSFSLFIMLFTFPFSPPHEGNTPTHSHKCASSRTEGNQEIHWNVLLHLCFH